MHKWFFLLLFPWLLIASPDHVVTYNKGSRFGDNLLCYLHAKWIAYQYRIPLRYKPFKYSSDLVLHDREMRLSRDPNKDKRLAVGLEKGPIDLQSEDSTLYICPYFPEDQLEKTSYYHFEVDWKNQEFRKIVRKMIAPKKRLRLVWPPKSSVNIAIHVREGGGYDPESAKTESPLKLPPMSFYVEGLSKILSLFPGKEIFCHVFTDALDPEKIVCVLRNAAPPNTSVKFSYRKLNNSHKDNVLEDFFSLFNFDILIRSQSHFSVVPSLIHDYAIVYSPMGASIEGDRVVIDKTNMEIHKELYQKLLFRGG